MFAALVIALPSEHTGGDLEQALNTSVQSEFSYSYLGWYADVNNLVKPVESGCRLVLTYNLMHTASSPSRKASNLDDLKLKSRQGSEVLGRSIRQEDYGTHMSLVYILEHEYSEANICLDYLKGKDKLRAQYLAEACRDQGFSLFLAHFQHSKWGRCDEDEYNLVHTSSYNEIYDVDDYKWELTTVFTSDGTQLAENMAVNEEDAVQADLFDNAEPDDEEYEGWTRNEGANTTHFYHRSCLVLMPRACRFEFLEEAANEGKANMLQSDCLIALCAIPLSFSASHRQKC